jgi:hypothetical protein
LNFNAFVDSDGNSFQPVLSLLATRELASLDSKPRANRESLASLEEKLERAFSETNISSASQSLVRSLVLLWHDYLDESHSFSQEIHNNSGSFLHGIMHRREPDYGNAKYWFDRVRQHPTFPIIAKNAANLFDKPELEKLKNKLIPDGTWNAFAFIDACETALRNPDTKTIAILQRIQEIEFKTLLEHFLRD